MSHTLTQSPSAGELLIYVTDASLRKANNYCAPFGRVWKKINKLKKNQGIFPERIGVLEALEETQQPAETTVSARSRQAGPGLKRYNFISDEITATPIMCTQLPVACTNKDAFK